MRSFSLFLCLLAAAAAVQAVDFTTLDGKVLLGYQGWFNCAGDGEPNRSWRSWARGTPSAKTLTVDMYPDLTEFNPSDLCPLPGFTIRGRQAFVYSAMNSNVVDRHFLWMKDYGLDGVLVQRFVTQIPARRAGGDVVLKNILQAARHHGRAIAIEYDITGASPEKCFAMMREDWKYLVTELKVTSHPCYLHHRGKPVLSVWGMGLSESRHVPRDPETALRVVHWFKEDAKPNQIPRNGGRFLWTQAWNARQAGARMLKIAMCDEVNEGTAVFKLAAKSPNASTASRAAPPFRLPFPKTCVITARNREEKPRATNDPPTHYL